MTKCLQLLALCLIALGAAIPARAQGTPKAEVSGGYQFIHFEESNWPKGWYFDVAGNLGQVLGIVGEVGGNYKSLTESGISVDGSVHEFMAGVRANARQNRNAAAFGQVLVGGMRGSFTGSGTVGRTTVTISESNTDFALQVGGGINVGGGGRLGGRIGADYIRIFSEGEGTNVFRFVAGVNVGLP